MSFNRVVQEVDMQSFERLFKTPVDEAHLQKLPKEQQLYAQQILKIGQRVTFIKQKTQEGFGHAVHCAKVGHCSRCCCVCRYCEP